MTILGWPPLMFAQQSKIQEKNATKALRKEKHIKKWFVEQLSLRAKLQEANGPNGELLAPFCICLKCKSKSWRYDPKLHIAECAMCKETYSMEFLTFQS